MPYPFHNQDCNTYCGPACLMMMLEKKGIGPAGLYQWHLMTSVGLARRVPGIAWGSSPEAMVTVANAMLGAPPGDPYYEIYPPQPPAPAVPTPTEAQFIAKIQSSIRNLNAPVFVLVWGGGHWTLVHKVTDTKYQIHSPGSLEYGPGSTVDHDSTTCQECGAGTTGWRPFSGLFASFNAVRSSDPTYDRQRIMLVPRRPVP